MERTGDATPAVVRHHDLAADERDVVGARERGEQEGEDGERTDPRLRPR
jgi:hypothetical protein